MIIQLIGVYLLSVLTVYIFFQYKESKVISDSKFIKDILEKYTVAIESNNQLREENNDLLKENSEIRQDFIKQLEYNAEILKQLGEKNDGEYLSRISY